MKNIIRTLAGVVLLSVMATGWAELPGPTDPNTEPSTELGQVEEQTPYIPSIERYLIDNQNYTVHKGVAGKNKGTGGNDLFLTGNKRRAGARVKNGTVDIRAGAGNDIVYADWAMRKIKRAQTSYLDWGAWGCDVTNSKATCLIREQTEIRQGVVAYMGSGNDEFYGSPHGDVAFTGDGNDRLYGFDGNDVLIANGSGESAHLYGGDGNDLLWNQREEGTVYHRPGENTGGFWMPGDSIIAGNGRDDIRLEIGYTDTPDQATIIIGFDPATDTLSNSESSNFSYLVPYSLSNDEEQVQYYAELRFLPSINILGHNFTLSTDAVDLNQIARGAIDRPGKHQLRRLSDGTISHTSPGQHYVLFLPLNGQDAVTLDDFQ